MLTDEYWYSRCPPAPGPVEPGAKMIRPTSQSHSTDSSMAFLTSACLRLANMSCEGDDGAGEGRVTFLWVNSPVGCHELVGNAPAVVVRGGARTRAVRLRVRARVAGCGHACCHRATLANSFPTSHFPMEPRESLRTAKWVAVQGLAPGADGQVKRQRALRIRQRSALY
jgi:hypothetical protein